MHRGRHAGRFDLGVVDREAELAKVDHVYLGPGLLGAAHQGFRELPVEGFATEAAGDGEEAGGVGMQGSESGVASPQN
jgi:hypothetical protein